MMHILYILYIVPYTPTPIRTRPYHLLRGLVARGHRVTLATLWESEGERAALADWQQLGVEVIAAPLSRPRAAWNSLLAVPAGIPMQASYCWQPQLAQALRAHMATAKTDVIHSEHLRGARYGLSLRPLAADQAGTPLVWDAVDSIAHLFQQASQHSRSRRSRWLTRLELGRTRRYEGWLVRQFQRVLVTSPVDRQAFAELAGLTSFDPANPLTVLPNGVDLAYFRPDEVRRDAATVVLSGKMSYHANVTAALHLLQDIMPLVWRRRPDTMVWIVGKDPPSRLCQLAAANPAHITVTGEVPDVRPYLQRATLAVAPVLYGAGIQNKVLEALACGAPVIASRQAVSALAGQPAQALIVADSAPDMAAAIVALLADPARQAELAQAGRAYVEQYHDWSDVAAQLEAIYAELIRQRRRD